MQKATSDGTGRTTQREGAKPAAVLGEAKVRTPTISALSAFSAHADCPTAAVALAVRADLDAACRGTPYEANFGQDPQAFRRGETFERQVKANGHRELITLLREHAGFPETPLRVENLRSRFSRNQHGLEGRAQATRELLAAISARDPSAPNIIDGAVLTAWIAGDRAYFEADSVAAQHDGRITVGEIKSFAKVDGRLDPDKLGAACDQAAWYVLLVRRTLEELGCDPGLVCDEALIITPEGIGLRPTITTVSLTRKIARAARLLTEAPNPEVLTADVPDDVSFPAIDEAADNRIAKLEGILDTVGNRYRPECLADCGLARLCRARAFEHGAVELTSAQIVRFLPGVRDLPRAAELSRGAVPTEAERHAAGLLARAGRLYDSAIAGRL